MTPDRLAYAEAVAGARYADARRSPGTAAAAAYRDAMARVCRLAGPDYAADLADRLTRMLPPPTQGRS